MIETIEEAVSKLRAHGKFCQRLVCQECDLHADVADLLAAVRRLLDKAQHTATWPSVDYLDLIARDRWSEEVQALLATLPVEEQTQPPSQETDS
jgi:hypothetical protein